MKDIDLADLKTFREEITRFMLSYKFAIEEMETKLNILNEEFHTVHKYNPIEHIKTRLKSPESLLKKINRVGLTSSLEGVKERIRDIAGVRIICSFVEDIYDVCNMIQNQQDITVIEVKDYIKNPKQNGYQSLHLIIQIPIFMSDRTENVYVEIQLRTIAMDFWASIEHKIYYKYNKEVPEHILKGLKEAAVQAAELDRKMEQLNRETKIIKAQQHEDNDYLTFDQLQQFAQRITP